MKKPDKVEAGQWWQYTSVEVRQVRAVNTDERVGELVLWVDQEDMFWASVGWVLTNCKYLGNGEHPEPSERMIDALARHGYEVACSAKDPALEVPWQDKTEYMRQHYRDGARLALLGTEDGANLVREFRLAVLSLYRILRERGEW